MASVTLDNVRKAFGPIGVIHGVSVDIQDGEFVVIVGPSGCGKSTLLRMVAGLEDVTSGTISIGDRSVEKLGPKDRNIAMVFQNYALYPHMSVYDNLAYGLKMRGVPKAEIGARVKRASEILEITEYLDRKPRNLSGGQRQRVAMGRAIVRDPAVFLFDEPLSNLDAKLRVQMRLEIKALQQSLGTTSIYVTHDQVEAMTLADRLIVMNKGNAEQIGPPMEVYEDPATTFVAGFIGSPAMNFLTARVSADRTVAVDAGSGGVHAVALLTKGLDPGRPVLLGVRPEHFVTVAEGAAGAIPLDVHVTEPLGSDTLLYGRVGSHPEVIAARLAGHKRNVTGRRAWFTAAAEHCFLFDAATGHRLR